MRPDQQAPDSGPVACAQDPIPGLRGAVASLSPAWNLPPDGQRRLYLELTDAPLSCAHHGAVPGSSTWYIKIALTPAQQAKGTYDLSTLPALTAMVNQTVNSQSTTDKLNGTLEIVELGATSVTGRLCSARGDKTFGDLPLNGTFTLTVCP